MRLPSDKDLGRLPTGRGASELTGTAIRQLALVVSMFILAVGAPAIAGMTPDQLAIARELENWARAFNAKNAPAACELFADDLIATIRGVPDRGRDEVCAQLSAALAKPDQQMTYTPDIHEIIVSHDLAAVRLVWTLTVRRGSAEHTSQEPGFDIFRRQANGAWKITRFMTFSRDPN